MSSDKQEYRTIGHESSRLFATRLDQICTGERLVNPAVLRSVIELAIELSREGREGKKIGTMFIIGDEHAVLKSSRELILDPLSGHARDKKHIDDPNMRETTKELAKLDGAFIISDDGVVVSAARYIQTNTKNNNLHNNFHHIANLRLHDILFLWQNPELLAKEVFGRNLYVCLSG